MSAQDLALANPLFGVAATACVYALAAELYRILGRPALLHPVLVATAVMALVLTALGMSYQTYAAQARPLHLALGAVVVLLAVPLYRQLPLIRASSGPIALALVVSSSVAVATALVLPVVTSAPDALLVTLAPKSATTAVAVQVAERLGGAPALTAIVVISTGIFGAAFGPSILARAGIQDDRAVGLALGIASHAIGTARALQISDRAGAFASLGMILNAGLTILLVPIVLKFL